MADTRRPAGERRRLLIQAGLEIAREEGASAVTLARVATACGVTKPIAYRLFTTLPELLAQMLEEVLAGYAARIGTDLEAAIARGEPRASLLEVLTRAYVDHSLGPGAVYDTVSAALAATASAEEPALVLPEEAVEVATAVFALPPETASLTVTTFLGAADHLVGAVQVGRVEAEDAIDHLVTLFLPLLPPERSA